MTENKSHLTRDGRQWICPEHGAVTAQWFGGSQPSCVICGAWVIVGDKPNA